MTRSLRWLHLPLAATMATALLLHAGPQRAYACSCVAPSGNPVYTQGILDYADLVVIGTAGPPVFAGDRRYRVDVAVERVYKGAPPPTVVVEHVEGSSASCGYEIDDMRRRQFLALTQSGDAPGVYIASACSAFPLSVIDAGGDFGRDFAAFLETLEQLAPPFDAPPAPPDPAPFVPPSPPGQPNPFVPPPAVPTPFVAPSPPRAPARAADRDDDGTDWRPMAAVAGTIVAAVAAGVGIAALRRR